MTLIWEHGKGWNKASSIDLSKVEVGVYELPTGEIFIARMTRDKQRMYAMKLVETSDRLNELDQVVKFDFEYARSAIYKLKPEYRMGFQRAKALMIQYGHCIVCGRKLKLASSVEVGIGPVCRKMFGDAAA